MRLILQRDESDCGIACMAMLAGTTYRQAKQALFLGTNRQTSMYTDTRDLRRGLKKLGYRTSRRLRSLRGRQLVDLKVNAVLKVNPKPSGSWHWVVWDAKRKRVLDPQGPVRRPYRYCSYLLVVRQRNDHERKSAGAGALARG